MKNLSTHKLALIITAAIVALILIVSAVIGIVYAVTNDVFFDYTKTNLSNYITLSKAYTGFELNVDIAEPRYNIDIEVSKLNMLCADKPKDVWIKGSEGAWDINPGDVVYIWYRGCVIVDGEEIWLNGMTNIPDSKKAFSSYGLEIGSNGFIPGFELGLVGQRTTSFDDLEYIKEGAVTGGTVAYISYKIGETTVSQERVDLFNDDVDAKYGEGFKAHLTGMTIGTANKFAGKVNDKDVIYENLTVDFVTTGEDKGLKIECYFPYDYSDETLRNLNATFYVYFDKIDRYYQETPVFDEEYLKKQIEEKDIAITLEELQTYGLEGDTLIQKYDAYAKELLKKIYDSEYESAVCSAIWEYYTANVKYDKNAIPVSKIDEIYYQLAYELYNQYEVDGGYIYDSYYGYQQYNTFNEYANAYCGINSYSQYYGLEDAWKYQLYDNATDMVKEKILLFYILRDANAIPTGDAFTAKLDAVKQDYVDQYLDQYIEEWFTAKGGSKDDYSDAEWEQFKKDRAKDLVDYYGEDKFEEKVYYALLSEQMVKWAKDNIIKINTLDTRHNYKKSETK